MNDGDFCVIPDKVKGTESSFNPLFILGQTSSETCCMAGKI
jgi:hypothetical protein